MKERGCASVQYGGKQGDNMKLSLVSVAVLAQYEGKQGEDKEDNMKLSLVWLCISTVWRKLSLVGVAVHQGKDKEDNMKLSLVSVAVHQQGRQYDGGKQGKDKEDNMEALSGCCLLSMVNMKLSLVGVVCISAVWRQAR